MLSRRALLSGVTFFGASALLVACGQQANNEASASATSTAALTETPSASAVATDSSSATPSTVRGYSGGSKAPDGEYRKADKHGNAQNVPKPNVPGDGYNEKSPEGMRKTLDAWTQWANYGTQTGDFTMARQFVSPTFENELNAYADIEDLYKSGGWVIEGTSEYQAESDLMYDEEAKEYWTLTRRLWTYGMYVNPNGKVYERTNTSNENEIFMFRYKYQNGYWRLSEHRSNKELREQGII